MTENCDSSTKIGLRSTFARALLIGIVVVVASAQTLADSVPFSEQRWLFSGEEWSVEEYLGRTALKLRNANAVLRGVDFYNGTIRFDVAMSRERGFSSIRWRRQPDFSGENVLLRNHKSEQQDALQYEAFHGFRSSWQLYGHDGYTTPVTIPKDEWATITVQVKDRAADVYFNSEFPVLHIRDLKGDDLSGVVQLAGANSGAYISKFEIDTKDPEILVGAGMDLPTAPVRRGAIREWKIVETTDVEIDGRAQRRLVAGYGDSFVWQSAVADPSGILNISEYIPAPSFGPSDSQLSEALARTSIWSDRDQMAYLIIGYSDHIEVYVNGVLAFRGMNRFFEHDRRYQGLVDHHREIALPLQEGENDLTFILGEEDRFGWGLVAAFSHDMSGIRVGGDEQEKH